MLHNSSCSSVPISQDDNQSGDEQQVLSDFRRPLKIMHLHDRPPFRLQNDDVSCNMQSIGNDSEQPPVFVDVKYLQKLANPPSIRTLLARSAAPYTMSM